MSVPAGRCHRLGLASYVEGRVHHRRQGWQQFRLFRAAPFPKIEVNFVHFPAGHPRAAAARQRFPSCMVADIQTTRSHAAYERKQAAGGGGGIGNEDFFPDRGSTTQPSEPSEPRSCKCGSNGAYTTALLHVSISFVSAGGGRRLGARAHALAVVRLLKAASWHTRAFVRRDDVRVADGDL